MWIPFWMILSPETSPPSAVYSGAPWGMEKGNKTPCTRHGSYGFPPIFFGGGWWFGGRCIFGFQDWRFFFWDVSLKIYWNNWNIIGVQRLIVFWNKVILWRWEQLQPDLQGLCQWSGNGTQMDHFLRPASVLAIAPLERCGKLERWNDICNSIDAVVFLKRNAGLFPLYRL